MRKLVCFLTALAGITGIMSCTKERVRPDGTGSLTIVNALIDTGYQSLMVTSNEISGPPQTPTSPVIEKGIWNDGNEFGFMAGKKTCYLYTVSNDRLASGPPLIKQDFDFPNGYIGSLFIAGTLKRPDVVVVRDHPVYFPPADSSMGLRFVNLMQGGSSVSVNIKGQANGAEAGDLPFKGITEFKKYAAHAGVGSYEFEFRNSGTGILLASYTISNVNNPGTATANLWRYRNFTLVLCGTEGSVQTPPSLFLVKNH